MKLMSSFGNHLRYLFIFTTLGFLFLFSQLTLAQSFSTAGFYSVENSPRTVDNFNIGWRFCKRDVADAEKEDFDDREWEAANLPHGLEILGENASGGRNYQGKAWYRKVFSVEKRNPGNKIYLYFEAVMGRTEVYVNGKKMTEHFGGYLPFAIDCSSILKDGKNVVAIMTDNSNSKLYPPGKIQEGLDFTYMGGIYRDTYLIETSAIHVTLPEISKTVAGAGVFAATRSIKGKNAEIEIRTELKNSSSKTQTIEVRTTIENALFAPLETGSQTTRLSSGEKKQLTERITVENAHFWHPDDPYLHFVRTQVLENGVIVDDYRTRLGIRTFEMRGPEGLFVNNKPYTAKLIGANRHQDYSFVGNALPNSGQYRDVKLLREGGCRIIRAGHYPQDPAFYDACDELGMFATTATPGWHFFNFKQPIFEERLYQDTRDLVRRDRHVASMLMWETALNETPSQPDHVMHRMHELAHEEFPFRSMYTVTDYQEAKKAGLDMYYHGNDDTVNSFTREYGDGGEVDNWKSQNATTRVKMEWGEKALLTHALMQAETLDGLYATPKVRLGGAKWAGIDHQRGYHPDPFWGGLLNGVRLPRYVYQVYKSQYDADYKVAGIETGPMLFVAHELTQVSPADIVVFSNCDEVRLSWLGEELATQKPSDDKRFEHLPHAPFIFKNAYDFTTIKSDWRSKTKDITLVAEGLINGEVVVREEKNYPEQSASISLSVDNRGINLTADGSDFVPVRATIVDPDGMKKVLASEYIHFEVIGNGELIGGNANNTNPEKTEFGVATALIRSSTKAGEITIVAHSGGLDSDTLTIHSSPLGMRSNFDRAYLSSSRKPKNDQPIIVQKKGTDLPADIVELQKELKRLQLDLVGKEQDIMELRSQIKED